MQATALNDGFISVPYNKKLVDFNNAIFIYFFQSKEVRISSVNLTEPQRALLGYISAGQEVLSRADEELRTKVRINDHMKINNRGVLFGKPVSQLD